MYIGSWKFNYYEGYGELVVKNKFTYKGILWEVFTFIFNIKEIGSKVEEMGRDYKFIIMVKHMMVYG